MNGDCKSGFPYKLFLNNTQIANIRKSFANNQLANVKLSKTQYLKPFSHVELLVELMKNVLTPLIKSVIVPLGSAGAASAINPAIQIKLFWMRTHNINNFK